MVCESWKAKLDTYLDGELPSEEMCAFDVHVHNCPSCSSVPLRAYRRSALFRSLENVLLPVLSSGDGCSRALRQNRNADDSASRG
jgi:predicted anti-sigma-YlaC factor YlaD